MKSYGSSHNYAALGITRRGTEDGRVVRTISMAGFRGFGAPPPANKIEFTTMAASNWLNEGCSRSAVGSMPATAFCECMYGNVDRISTGKNPGSANFRTGSARWACQLTAEWNFPPWSDDSLLAQIVASAGKADPLKSLPTSEKIAAYKQLVQSLGDKELGIPGTPLVVRAKDIGGQLEAWGLVPPGTFGAVGSGSQQIVSSSEAEADARSRSDEDLYQLTRNPVPDPLTRPGDALRHAAYVSEYNFRVQNLCPGLGYRDYAFGTGANGRPNCGGSRRRASGAPALLKPPFDQKQLEDLVKRNTPGGDGGPAPNTALIAGGIAVAVAAIFLLKK